VMLDELLCWRDLALSGIEDADGSTTVLGRTELEAELRKLEKDVRRKNEALAETAALLVLQKKNATIIRRGKVSAEDRRAVIGLIDEAVASGARQSKACSVIHLDERRLRNWRTSDGDGRTGGYRAEKQAMSAAEKDAIVEAFSASDVKRLPPKQAFVRLLDRGVYVSSYSTFLRVLKERNVLGGKRHRNRTGTKKRPALTATAPKQVWCWDITWL
jgi:putative transposase